MTPESLAMVMEQTWPPAAALRIGPWTVRDGRGGGKRVSAATADGAWGAADIATAEMTMQSLGQPRLFLIRQGDDQLDDTLAGLGYDLVDPVVAYAAPVHGLTTEPLPPMTTFAHWPPLAVAGTLWADGGIGPERLAVMHRVVGRKTAILSRLNDRAAGVAFVAIADGHAMLHALEVAPAQRRQGSAHHILRAAAAWAQDHGAYHLSLVVTAANAPARAVYASLGMQAVGQYHYRQK